MKKKLIRLLWKAQLWRLERKITPIFNRDLSLQIDNIINRLEEEPEP